MLHVVFSALFFATTAHAQVALPPGFAEFGDQNLNSILGRIVGTSKVVAIGESIHGTGEYTKFEARVLKYLVESKGFRVFVLENPRLRSEGMTAALDRCGGSVLPMDLLYFPAQEDRDLFEWVRKFNCSHRSNPIRFRGIDIWDRYWEMQDRILSDGKALKVPRIETLAAIMKEHCLGHNLTSWTDYQPIKEMLKREKHIPKEHFDACMQSLTEVIRFADIRLQTATSSSRVLWARYLQILNTAYSRQENLNYYYSDDFTSDWNARDRGQARNVHYVLEEFGSNQKVIWISHTSHTSHMKSGSDWWKTGLGRFKSAVYFYEHLYRQPVTNMMLTAYHATGAQGDFEVPTSPDSLDLYLHQLGAKQVVYNPCSQFVRSKKRWWLNNENSLDDYRDGVYMVPEDNFDAFFYFDETLKGQKIEPWHSPWEW